VALTPQFLMKPATLGGQPVTSLVNIPVAFNADGLQGGGRGGDKMASPAMDWPEAPSYADVAAAYPKRAREAHLGGRATLTCKFNNTGRLTQCQVIAEEPKGQGFGFAAQALVQRFRAYPKTSDGRGLLGVDVQIPFVFDPAMLGDAKPAIGTPQWMGLPSGAQTGQAFDAVIKAGAPTVRVTMACTVQPGGGLADCSVTREDPPGKGVGAAALSLTPLFKVSTWTVEGLPTVGGAINIPLRYEGAPPPPATAP
jgi:TonB family protein